MKTLSKRCKYALSALYCLTRQYDRATMPTASIAETQRIPRKFLEAILVQLRNGGLVESRQGKHGGYVLAKPPEQITLGAVIRLMDGPLAPLPCASERHFRKCEECGDHTRCETRGVMKEVRDAIAGILDATTLAQVCAGKAAADFSDFSI